MTEVGSPLWISISLLAQAQQLLLMCWLASQVFAVATEDMDALTFGTPTLLRHMTFSEARKMPIKEISLPKLLDEAGLSQEEVNLTFHRHFVKKHSTRLQLKPFTVCAKLELDTDWLIGCHNGFVVC